VFAYPASKKSLNGGPGAFGSDHSYEAKATRLLIGAFHHNIDIRDIAVSGKDLLQFFFGRGGSDVFNIYFVGHNGVQSPSLIFIRVTDAVEPFDFEFVSSHRLPLLFNSRRDGLRQQPDLFGKLGNGEADEFQSVHSDGPGFNFPQSARSGKKAAPATISVLANPSL
jgi:hypothetical protein